MDTTTLGLGLVLIGFVVVVAALLMSARTSGPGTKGAAVVMVGPIPLIFGSDSKWASVAIALAIVLVLLSLLFYVL